MARRICFEGPRLQARGWGRCTVVRQVPDVLLCSGLQRPAEPPAQRRRAPPLLAAGRVLRVAAAAAEGGSAGAFFLKVAGHPPFPISDEVD